MMKVLVACSVLVFCVTQYSAGAYESETDVSPTASSKKERASSNILNLILEDMDNRVRPKADGPPVEVNVNFHIISFSSVSEAHMEYTVDIYLRQGWTDERLAWSHYSNNTKPLVANAQIASKIWVPDIFFTNEKRASFHMVTVPNILLRIHPNGTVAYSKRLTLTLACAMLLTHFPMDTQECSIHLESFGYDTHEMRLKWTNDDAIQMSDHVELPQFELIGTEHNERISKYSTGEFASLTGKFRLHREFGYYLCQTYIPSVLIVILSWISFWINMDAVPARISLGVTSVLTMTTQFSGSRANMPRVSYPKALDIWMAMCMIFVFSSLLEFAIVNVFSRKEKRSVKNAEKKSDGKEASGENIELEEIQEQANKRFLPCFKSRRDLARGIDKLSRVMFPCLFVVFNIAYWPVYMSPR